MGKYAYMKICINEKAMVHSLFVFLELNIMSEKRSIRVKLYFTSCIFIQGRFFGMICMVDTLIGGAVGKIN